MRAVLVYTGARLALFAVVLGILYAVGLTGLLLVLAALVLSGVMSYLLLTRQRAAMGEVVHNRVQAVHRLSARYAQRTASEDAYVDDQLRRREDDGVQRG
jgi:uncharacterized membrane protein